MYNLICCGQGFYFGVEHCAPRRHNETTASSPSLWTLKRRNWKQDILNECQLAPNHSEMITLGMCKLKLLQTVHLSGCDVCNSSVVLKISVCPLASWPNLGCVNHTDLDFWNPVCWEFEGRVMPSSEAAVLNNPSGTSAVGCLGFRGYFSGILLPYLLNVKKIWGLRG